MARIVPNNPFAFPPSMEVRVGSGEQCMEQLPRSLRKHEAFVGWGELFRDVAVHQAFCFLYYYFYFVFTVWRTAIRFAYVQRCRLGAWVLYLRREC